ncbi:hypothetical protein KIPB_016431, partial [Kipferlia bialata]|eukprot:g16431.t1
MEYASPAEAEPEMDLSEQSAMTILQLTDKLRHYMTLVDDFKQENAATSEAYQNTALQ